MIAKWAGTSRSPYMYLCMHIEASVKMHFSEKKVIITYFVANNNVEFTYFKSKFAFNNH